ncbi:hypothetical protein EV426DRAFT_605255 [Tirmania nivea]|nr:hypothetical protein EV426DRAFT_605255 [Tirmania nivea]
MGREFDCGDFVWLWIYLISGWVFLRYRWGKMPLPFSFLICLSFLFIYLFIFFLRRKYCLICLVGYLQRLLRLAPVYYASRVHFDRTSATQERKKASCRGLFQPGKERGRERRREDYVHHNFSRLYSTKYPRGGQAYGLSFSFGPRCLSGYVSGKISILVRNLGCRIALCYGRMAHVSDYVYVLCLKLLMNFGLCRVECDVGDVQSR